MKEVSRSNQHRTNNTKIAASRPQVLPDKEYLQFIPKSQHKRVLKTYKKMKWGKAGQKYIRVSIRLAGVTWVGRISDMYGGVLYANDDQIREKYPRIYKSIVISLFIRRSHEFLPRIARLFLGEPLLVKKLKSGLVGCGELTFRN